MEKRIKYKGKISNEDLNSKTVQLVVRKDKTGNIYNITHEICECDFCWRYYLYNIYGFFVSQFADNIYWSGCKICNKKSILKIGFLKLIINHQEKLSGKKYPQYYSLIKIYIPSKSKKLKKDKFLLAEKLSVFNGKKYLIAIRDYDKELLTYGYNYRRNYMDKRIYYLKKNESDNIFSFFLSIFIGVYFYFNSHLLYCFRLK